MKTDMLELLYRASTDTLGADGFSLEWHPFSSVVVVLATEGYPGAYKKGSVIKGLDAANSMAGVTVFHAGTAAREDGSVIAVGGRVLGVTADGESIADAQRRAYAGVDAIKWPEGFCRRDIGWRAVAREQQAQTAAK
jgi:phosphoribosylamine---glycine ligase